ncbi:hypothetical protein P8C59_007450 [Phyllachora maydis]|uniref:Uncharacterized protein n=1 Tax=Phyllachora maydis TaxID=1825666 RepID=A0AAD9IAB2_9PEZI|nr:hypothetical protein P8C59_007450 [Phyllachora maydis]
MDGMVGPALFQVTNMIVGAIVLSHRVQYQFGLTYDTSVGPVSCLYLGTDLAESLVNVTNQTCGPDTDIFFSWRQFPDNSALLEISHQLSDSLMQFASRPIANNETTVEASGAFSHQVYIGPSNFTIPSSLIRISGPPV